MKTKIGYMECESCGERVAVKRNENDTLSYRCDECDAAPYARPSTKQHANWYLKVASHPDTRRVEPAQKVTVPVAEKPVLEKPAADKKPVVHKNIWGI